MRPLGPRGEDIAVKYLKKQGYRVLKRNYKAPPGEVDIIAEKDGTVVFVEVKTRSDDAFGLPQEAVGERKQRKMRETALYYLSGLKEQPRARFDIISISMAKGSKKIEHIPDAFQ
jgi:putative endonuclease